MGLLLLLPLLQLLLLWQAPQQIQAASNSMIVEVKPFETELNPAEGAAKPAGTPARVQHPQLHQPLTSTTRVPVALPQGPEAAFRSRCWKSGFSPPDGRPVDHTPGDFLAAPACRGRVHLVSIVHSAVANRNKRDLIRRTWGSVLNVEGSRLVTVFVLGMSANEEENRQVEQESQEFGDLVLANFLDHYRNLTYKNLYGIRWALEHCNGTRFVLKVDDDVLVNPFQLIFYIADRLGDAKNFFYCRTSRETKMTERWQKWYVTPEEWPESSYPVHCKGLGYLFSADLLQGLHLCAKWRRYFWIDDIFVTGAVGQALGAAMLHWAPGWDFQYLHPRHTGRQVNEAILYNELDSMPISLLTRRVWRAMLVYST